MRLIILNLLGDVFELACLGAFLTGLIIWII